MPVSGTNIVASADVLQSQLEVVRNKLQDLFEDSDQVSARINKQGEVEQISQKLFRIPVRKFRGGTFQKYNADAGDMGNGSGMSVDKVTAGFIYSNLAFELSQQSIDTTSSNKQAIVNELQDTLAYAMSELQVYDDIVFHTNGSGQLTNSGSLYSSGSWNGGASDSMTFAAAGDNVSIIRLREGMCVNVFNAAGTSQRTTSPAPLQIDHIDYINKIVYFNGTISSGNNTDILAFAGTSANLQSFQSGWPLSGDTFRHGLYYANDATGSNYYLGQLKSNFTQLMANNINAASASLQFIHGMQLKDQIVQHRDASVLKGAFWVAHMAQRTAIFNIGVAISNWLRSDQSQKMIDVMPSNNEYGDTFEFCGVEGIVSKRQDKSRLDLIQPRNWGRAHLKPADFYKVGGQMIFPGRVQATGNLKASQFFAIVQTYDFVCYDPGAQGYVSSLQVPSGY